MKEMRIEKYSCFSKRDLEFAASFVGTIYIVARNF